LEKLTVANLYKIFGSAPQRAIDLARQGASKDEIYSQTGNVVAADDISFSVAQGEIFVVMGLSGSGKSTLVRCLNRLIEPTSGRIALDADSSGAGEVTGAGPEALRQIRLRRISMVFQHFALLPHRKVVENVEYGLKARGMPARERRERARRALAMVGLEAWADAYPGKLSGGMQQRVGLARALAVEPEVLLMDEPFSALDPLIRREVQDQLLKLQDEIKTTIVFITHDLQEALKLGDHIAIMRDGKFVQIGSPEAIVSRPSDDYVRAFTSDVDRSRVLTPRRMMTPLQPIAAETGLDIARRALNSGATACVTDAEGKPLGLVTQDSIVAAAPDARLADAMERGDLATVHADTHLHRLFGQLQAGRPLVVIDDSGRYLGLLDPLEVFAHLGTPDEGGREPATGGPIDG
jgi:glycine betaine/proline transport system ATP-binding protein